MVGLDTGERKNKTVAVRAADGTNPWDPHAETHTQFFDNPVDAVLAFPNEKIVLENSTCNFDPKMRSGIQAAAVSGNSELYAIDPRHTKNRRLDHGVKKDDRNDAWVLLQIGLEGIIPRARFQNFRQLSSDPVARLRQVGYDITDPEMEAVVPGIREAFSAVLVAPIPDCAVTVGAAKMLKKGPRWELGYRFYTPLIVAMVCVNKGRASHRALKSTFRLRGTSRSNMRYHPLRGKPREERKTIMKAQDEFNSWVLSTLTAHRLQFAETSSASHMTCAV